MSLGESTEIPAPSTIGSVMELIKQVDDVARDTSDRVGAVAELLYGPAATGKDSAEAVSPTGSINQMSSNLKEILGRLGETNVVLGEIRDRISLN